MPRTPSEGTGMTRTLLAAVLTAGAAAACAPSAAAEVRIFACEPEWAALAEEIGGDNVVAFSATHAGQDPHYIRARPSLIAQVRRADVLLCSGAELEVGWLPVLMQRGARRIVQPGESGHIMAADHVEVLGQPEVVDRSLGDIHPSGNPHVHLDPRNIVLVATVLAERLAEIDLANAEAYSSRLASFQARWSEAMEGWERRLAGLRGMRVIVYHQEWVYFLNWSGLERAASLERAPGIPPSASHLRTVLERARGADVKAILKTPFESDNATGWLSERAGIPVVELPYTVGGRHGADNLFSLFDVTLALLEDARNQP